MKSLVFLFASVVLVQTTEVRGNKIPRSANVYVDPIALPDTEPNLKIIKGKESDPHSIPYMVYIYFEGFLFTWSCGGTLIKPRFVLTAAHCLDWAEKIEVRLGCHNITGREVTQVKVDGIKWKQHEKYERRTIINDIGVIELAYPIYPNNEIAYAKLPDNDDFWQSFEGSNARVSGWGYTTSGLYDQERTDVLREVNNTILDNKSCNDTFGVVEKNEICLSGHGGKGACNGDSGGPLVIGDVQQGIVSYGARGCLTGYPTVYCRISHFLEWIDKNTFNN